MWASKLRKHLFYEFDNPVHEPHNGTDELFLELEAQRGDQHGQPIRVRRESGYALERYLEPIVAWERMLYQPHEI